MAEKVTIFAELDLLEDGDGLVTAGQIPLRGRLVEVSHTAHTNSHVILEPSPSIVDHTLTGSFQLFVGETVKDFCRGAA